MCGIVGYIGNEQAAPILLECLSKLEYRGYDSAGICVRNDTDELEIVRAKGRLGVLAKKTDNGNAVAGGAGIGHTRWATHGEPSEINSHPHMSDDKNVVLVHNGIIENFQELKDKLIKKGYTFYSETDTEVAAKLIDYYYKKFSEPLTAISTAMTRIRGSYAFGIIFKDIPGKIYAARKDSPLIIGKGEKEAFLASDAPAILSHTRVVCYIENLEIVEISADEIKFYNLDRELIEKEFIKIEWDAQAAEKGGYEHFMMKEIHEQPKAVQDTIEAYVKDGSIDLSQTGIPDELFEKTGRIYIAACGSASYVSSAGRYVIEGMARVPVECDLASEFRYRDPIFAPDSVVIIISQSGETADSLAALRLAKSEGIPVIGIVNVMGSSIARESDYCMYTYAGPEIAVATTKAYSTQLIAMYLLAIRFAMAKRKIGADECRAYLDEMGTIPGKIEKVLSDKERIQWFASKYAGARDVFFIGRGIDYAICLEGSLKLKEISYIHSEAYAAGELKHGTISLIEDGTLVVGVLTQEALREKTLSNMVEAKSRGAYLMGLTSYGFYSVEDKVDFAVYVPKTNPYFATSLAVIPLQLMGYYVSVAKGIDPDKPRNLAKSVTVE